MTIQEILEAHKHYRAYVADDYSVGVTCTCGEEILRRGMISDASHRAHVAEVLDKHMQAGVRQAQVNVLNGVASAWEEMALPGANHLYARMLREAANRIGGEPNGR